MLSVVWYHLCNGKKVNSSHRQRVTDTAWQWRIRLWGVNTCYYRSQFSLHSPQKVGKYTLHGITETCCLRVPWNGQ